MPFLTYGSETIIWRGKERFRIKLYRWTTSENCWVSEEWIVPNVRIRELCGVTKSVDEKIGEDVLRLPGHVERMDC